MEFVVHKTMYILIMTLSMMGPVEGIAQQLDSIRTHQLGEVVVTATRFEIKRSWSPLRISTLSRMDIDARNGTTLGELLESMTSIVARQYGVGGGVQTLSIRGMGAEHSLILLDGLPLNNRQTGLTDLRLIPEEILESIEIVRGGGSSMYGSDAIGGVVSVVTTPRNEEPMVFIRSGVGSFGASRLALGGRMLFGNGISLSASVTSESGIGDYVFAIPGSSTSLTAVRSNSDYHTRSYHLRGSWSVNPILRNSFVVSQLSTDRGSPGPFTSMSNQGRARLADEQLLFGNTLVLDVSPSVQLNFVGGVQNAYERYLDEGALSPADNYYRNTTLTVNTFAKIGVNDHATIAGGLETDAAFANGNALAEPKTRGHVGVFVTNEFKYGVSKGLQLGIYPSLRFDAYQSTGEAVSPRLGVTLSCFAGSVQMVLRSSVGREFRVPTFNELYYAGAGGLGNVALDPERAMNTEVGMSARFDTFGKHEVDVTYYSIQMKDRILWMPTSSIMVWSPVNVGRTQTTGIEIEYHWSTFANTVEFDASYTAMDARKQSTVSTTGPTTNSQLLYVPLETGSLFWRVRIPISQLSIESISWSLGDTFTGVRYTTEDNSESLPSFHVMKANFVAEAKIFNLTMKLKYEVNNLGDIGYETVPRYPMPLRNYAFSLNLTKIL